MRISPLWFLSTFALLFTYGCGESKTDSATAKFTEQVSENEFRNEYFNFTITKPDTWFALDHSASKEILALGSDIVSAGNDELEAILEATEKNNFPLFSIFKYEPGTPVELNPSVMGLAENIRFAPGIKSGKDYFFHARNLNAQTNGQIVFGEGYTERTIGGVVFDRMDATFSIAGTEGVQSYYAKRYENFMVLIVTTDGTGSDVLETDHVLNQMVFDW